MNFRSLLVALILALAAAGTARAAEVEILNAFDAFGRTKRGMVQHFGFSAVVRYRGKTILFDAGADRTVFAANLRRLAIDPKKIDVVVVSHNHHDHISGLDYLLKVNPNVRLYLPRDFTLGASVSIPVGGSRAETNALPRRQRYFNGRVRKIAVKTSGRFPGARITWVDRHQRIGKGLRLIFTRSKLMGRFIKYPPHDKKPKFVGMPEVSLSVATRSGDIVLVGCSHSSVEAIVRTAKATSNRPLRLVAGGYHLIPYSRKYLEGLAHRLRDRYKVGLVAPCHCTGHRAFGILKAAYGKRFLFFGLGSVLRL